MSKKYPTVFDLVHDVFNRSGAQFVLIGGFVVNHYKVLRQTNDVDFMIVEDDYERVSELLKQVGYKEDYRKKAFAHLLSPDASLIDIDLMFVDENTISKILAEGKVIKIAGLEFHVPSLSHLIMLKAHALKNNYKIREMKDLPDIINLIRENKLNIKTAEFKKMFLKFGTAEIYNKISNLI